MDGWIRLNCDACGHPAEVQENTAIYKCGSCGNVYERVRQANGECVQVAYKDAMTRMLSATEFVKAKAFIDSLPGFIREDEAELEAAQADLAAAQSELEVARARADQAAQRQLGFALAFGIGAVVLFAIAVFSPSPQSRLLWMAICLLAIAGAAWNFMRWRKMRSTPTAEVEAATTRVAEATAHCAALQEEIEEARLDLALRQAQVKHNIREELGRSRRS
jgi:predicted RNA-binding Zn-ribbon protein involved in translation (DUF1610 family)